MKLMLAMNQILIESDYYSSIKEYIEKYFPIVRASTLSLKDKFLKHEPASEKQKVFKKFATFFAISFF